MAGSRLRGAGPGALVLAVLAAFLFIPVAGAFLIFIFPAPLAYSRLSRGSMHFMLLSVACLAMTVLAGGFPFITLILAGLSVMALSLAGSVEQGEKEDRAVLKGALSAVLPVGIAAGVYFLAAGVNPWALLEKTLDEGLKESIQIYRQMGMNQSDIDSLTPSLLLLKRIITDYLPAVSITLAAFTAFMSYYLLRRHAVARGLAPAPVDPMSRWHAPDATVWGVILPGFLMIPDIPVARLVGGNLLSVFAIVYLFQGVAVASFYFDKARLSPVLRAVAVLIALIQPVLVLIVCGVGLFDTWVDFRKLRPGRKST